MSDSKTAVYSASQTAELLAFPRLMATLKSTVADYANGLIQAPERHALQFPGGGVMLSMPATARDIGIHKLVNVMSANRLINLPTIHGLVSAFDGTTGQELFVLDGPTVTARRTAAVSMLGLTTLLGRPPKRVALVGTGTQAQGHVQAIAALFPGIQVAVIGTTRQKAVDFIRSQPQLALHLTADDAIADDMDVVITVTTSKTPVYAKAPRAACLLVAVGAFQADSAEIAAQVVLNSQVYVDDLASAHNEAGDLILAGVDWSGVKSLAHALAHGVDFDRPIVYKTVGCAAWDLAAARCALAAIKAAR